MKQTISKTLILAVTLGLAPLHLFAQDAHPTEHQKVKQFLTVLDGKMDSATTNHIFENRGEKILAEANKNSSATIVYGTYPAVCQLLQQTVLVKQYTEQNRDGFMIEKNIVVLRGKFFIKDRWGILDKALFEIDSVGKLNPITRYGNPNSKFTMSNSKIEFYSGDRSTYDFEISAPNGDLNLVSKAKFKQENVGRYRIDTKLLAWVLSDDELVSHTLNCSFEK